MKCREVIVNSHYDAFIYEMLFENSYLTYHVADNNK